MDLFLLMLLADFAPRLVAEGPYDPDPTDAANDDCEAQEAQEAHACTPLEEAPVP